MDRQLWRIIRRAVTHATRKVGRHGRRKVYPDRLIVLLYLWANWHDQCLSWACDPLHYNTLLRPRALPSISQFCRRVKSDSVRAILQRVHEELAGLEVEGTLSYVDGKPLLVSPVSKDPDAARGHVTGGFAKGYKLHAFVSESRRIVCWSVMPLNADEKTVARAMLGHLPPPADPLQSLTLADSNYDSAPLYADFADHGRAMLAPVRGQQFVGPEGRSAKKLKAMGPARRAALAVWEHHPHLARYVAKTRNNIEGVFSVLATAWHLHALPAFVRRLDRVRRWVGAKIILYHAHLLAREQARPHVAQAA